ncbi:DUF4272 domain-containing protein [Flavitalea sp.]|nr:DUF4272 domain-containing protein [Flavitalea sp.]
MSKSISKTRWDKLRQRMIAYGIQDVPLTAIPENITEAIKEPEEAAARMLILLSVAFCASNSAEADKIADWLKKEDLWQAASENEKFFFREHETTDEEKAKLSFQFEGAYMLAWVLGRVEVYPDPSSECDLELVGDFFANVPPVLAETDDLFEDAGFERITSIHDEYLFYKMAALYFKHIKKTDKENTSNVHSAAAHQRYLVLEWLLNPDDLEWDQLIELFNGEE